MLFVSLIHIYGTLIVYRITMGVRLRNVLKNVVLLEVDKVISRLFILLFNEMKMFFLNENHTIRQMRMQSYFSFLFWIIKSSDLSNERAYVEF